MRKAAYYSAGLHLGIVFFAAVIWPLLDFDREMPEPIMPVEIVASLPQSKAEPTPEPKAEPAPEPPKEAKPEPPTPTPPTPPPPQPPAPKVEQQPEAIPLPKPQPPKPEPPKETAQPQPQEPQVRPVVKEKPEPPTQNKNLMASVLKTVEKLDQDQKKMADKPAPKTETQTPPNSTVSNLDRTRREAQLGDLVRQQIKQCWNVPAGAKDIQNMVVEIRMQLGPDGAVQRVEPRDAGRMASDPFYRTVAESAMRAVLNPRCNPLKLPPDSYDIWRDMTLVFSPKDLV
jgi:outer membrane biosynthesis protein TonB